MDANHQTSVINRRTSVTAETSITGADHPWKERLKLLLAQPMLSAINAGWATQPDLELVGPILAEVHRKLADAGIRSLHLDKNHPCSSALQIDDHKEEQALAILNRPGISGLPRNGALPSCAKFFINSVTDLYECGSPRAQRAVVRTTLQLSALSLAAMENALSGAGADVATTLALHKKDLMPNGGGDESDVIDMFLTLQLEFLSDLFNLMRLNRLSGASERIQARRSLELPEEPPVALFPGVGEIMFEEKDEKRDIEFTVERYPCTAEVLDPRVVRIPAGKYNNRHVHAHETLFMFLSGTGEILVGEKWVKVKGGDAVFAPRWAIHQTHNTGTQELVLLAITDYYLTSQVYVGKYDKI